MTDAPPGNAGNAKEAGGGRRCIGPTVAGSWYTAEPKALAREIDRFLDAGAKAVDPRATVRALIAPHAGFRYSGAVAGHGFAWLRGKEFKRVVLLGPSHHAAFPGAALPSAELYRTPLGEIELDTEAIATLREQPGFRIDEAPFQPEHCLEAEILFLQRALVGGWSLLPLLIGARSSSADAEKIAHGLRTLVTPGSVIVVSSDFTHFGPRFGYVPFRDELPHRIEQLDMGAVERIRSCDPRGFSEYTERTGATICGRDAIAVLLRLVPADLDVLLSAYDCSGRMTGSWDHSVSYASLVFRDPAGPGGTP